MSQELVDSVNDLTNETTKLLGMYADSKVSIDNKVATAAQYAVIATEKAEIATDKADIAVDKANVAIIEAANAKASADKASQVSGLDTVAEAVQVALADSYQYAMTKADFDANREINKEKYAGSGWVEWGNQHTSRGHSPINQGLYSAEHESNLLMMGTNDATTVVSKTKYPIITVDGCTHDIAFVNRAGGSYSSAIKSPPACDGTKSYDSATGIVTDHLTYLDPKYDNTAALSRNDAVSRCFEGCLRNSDFRLGIDGWSSVKDSTVTLTDGVLHTKTSASNNALVKVNCNIKKGQNIKVSFDLIDLSSIGSCTFRLQDVYEGDETIYTAPSQKGDNISKTFTAKRDATYIIIYSGGAGAEYKMSNIRIDVVTSNPILTRQDLVFLESWQEDTSEKGVLVPLGNVQYGATEWNDIPLKKLTELGVGQGYSAFGDWDKETVGYGALISELTDAQLKKFLQDPQNNIYFDAETGKLVQVRYRVRVEPLGVDGITLVNALKSLGFEKDKTDITRYNHSNGSQAIGICLAQR